MKTIETNITLFLTLAQQGDQGAENQAYGLVYDRLRSTARALMSRERRGHTLRSAALVSEAFVQKLRSISTPILSREHFYSLAARAMRQVLIDHARHDGAARRSLTPETMAELMMRIEVPDVTSADRLAAQQAFDRLAKLDRNVAECIRLRFIVGLTVQETADRLNRPAWKVRDECEFGLRWMARSLGGSR